MGRTKGAVIKDLRYDNWFAITFKYYDMTYIYCKPEDKWTFHCLERTTPEKIKKLNIKKCKDKEEANRIIRSIPDFEMGSSLVYLEVTPHSLLEDWL